MRKKLVTFLIVVVALTLICVSRKVSADSSASFSFTPQSQETWLNASDGSVFEASVNVTISNASAVYAWQFGFFWNSQYLNFDSIVIYTPQIWSGSAFTFDLGLNNAFNSTNGYELCAQCALGDDVDTFNGTFTVATLTFHQISNSSATTTSLNFDTSWTIVVDVSGSILPSTCTDASVTTHPGRVPTSPKTYTITSNWISNLNPVPSNWANWNCSNANDGDSSYVRSSDQDDGQYYDLYQADCSWLPLNATNVNITVHIVVKSQSGSYKATTWAMLNSTSTGTQTSSTSWQPSTSYQDDSYTWSILQGDGASVRVGVKIESCEHWISTGGGTGYWFYYAGRCTQVYAVVSWS